RPQPSEHHRRQQSDDECDEAEAQLERVQIGDEQLRDPSSSSEPSFGLGRSRTIGIYPPLLRLYDHQIGPTEPDSGNSLGESATKGRRGCILLRCTTKFRSKCSSNPRLFRGPESPFMALLRFG